MAHRSASRFARATRPADPSSTGFRIASTLIPGDANADGKVDINDLTIVLTNFGYGVTAPSISPAPEPSTVALFGVGAMSLLAYRWRRRV